MKRLIPLILLMGFSLQLSAQEYYYYYKGAKVNLELNTEYLFIAAPNKRKVNKARINASIDAKHNRIIHKDNTSQTLLKPDNFKEKNPVRFWQEIKLSNSKTHSTYLSQIQATRTSNPDLIVAPYFKTKNIEKIGLSNFFYVKLKKEGDLNLLLDLVKKYNAELVGYNKFMPLWYTISVSAQSLDALQLANLFYETGLFQSTEPDLMVDRLIQGTQGTNDIEMTPNDPYYTKQWCLNNTGRLNGIAGIDIKAAAAWDLTLGDNVKVAVVDQGIEMTHPDLDDNIIGVGYDTNTGTSPSIVHGAHGTQCAGIIAAEGNNNQGVIGVAPNAGLISISQSYVGTNVIQELADGISWAWNDAGADVISNSWGGGSPSNMMDDAINDALTMGRGGLGTILVFASGNFNTNGAEYPGNSTPLILCVGANDRCGVRSGRIDLVPDSCDPWCSTCRASSYGIPLDVVAGGSKISTCNPERYTKVFSGTSAACPYVAGVAALMLSINTDLTVQEVNDIIEQSAQKIRTDLYTYSTTSGRPNGAWNNEMGYGLVDAHQAVVMAYQCPIDLNITETYNNGDFEDLEADNNITSSSSIQSGANITFDAGNEITLTSDFHAKEGSEFSTAIDGCGGSYKTPSPPTNIPVEEGQVFINNLPNPFKEQTNIEYTLTTDTPVSIQVFDLSGRLITNLVDNEYQISGSYTIPFNAKGLQSGVYIFQIQTDQTQKSGKMILLD